MLKYNHKWYMFKLKLKQMWPLRWKNSVEKERNLWYTGERARHKEELDKVNYNVDKLLPHLIKAKYEKHYGSDELIAYFRVDAQMVRALTNYQGIDQQIWDYLAERMSYEFKRQLQSMNFSQIKVVYPNKPKYNLDFGRHQ